MFRHFLVPVDGTDACIEAIGQAVEFAQSIGARITFLPLVRPHAATRQRVGADARANPEMRPTAAACETGGRAWELLTRAEAAARAQGVPCSSCTAGDEGPCRSIFAAAGKHGCDLICSVPPRQADGSASSSADGSCVGKRSSLAAGDVAVLICAIDPRPAVSGAIGRLLAEHRAMAGELHACLDMIRAAVARGVRPDLARVRETVKRLRVFQARLHWPKEEAWLFPRLRERTAAVDAELDELEHQHQRGDQLLDELAAIVEQNPVPGVPAGQLEQAVCAYAQFTWEHMGREEGVVLPAARRHLTDADWLEIAMAFDALALDPVITNI